LVPLPRALLLVRLAASDGSGGLAGSLDAKAHRVGSAAKGDPMSPQATDTKRSIAWVVVLTAIGSFMGALDTLVVSTALPPIRLDLGASVSQLEWTVNAYNLAFAVMLVTAAALGDRFGRRRLYAAGLVGFAAASAASALSQNVGMLIAARAVQGVGAAFM